MTAPVAIKMQTSPQALLTSRSQGWQQLRNVVLKSVPGDQYGNPTIPVIVEGFEWVDVTLFGWGNVDNSMQQLQQAIQQRGSDLYSYAMFTRTDFDFLGVKVVRYRIVLLHSFVELAEWAIAILAIGFAAVIFLQYLTTGQAPALKDLQNLWGSAVTAVGNAGGTIIGGATNVYLTWVAAAGGIAILLGIIAKKADVKAPPGPNLRGSIGVNAGPVRGSVSG
jgi:hypothetical protein